VQRRRLQVDSHPGKNAAQSDLAAVDQIGNSGDDLIVADSDGADGLDYIEECRFVRTAHPVVLLPDCGDKKAQNARHAPARLVLSSLQQFANACVP
jgi:hypothetical protein